MKLWKLDSFDGITVDQILVLSLLQTGPECDLDILDCFQAVACSCFTLRSINQATFGVQLHQQLPAGDGGDIADLHTADSGVDISFEEVVVVFIGRFTDDPLAVGAKSDG